jgi:lysine 6-dehydrogenase
LKILALGIGKIGSALIRDLVESPDVSEIVGGDIDFERVQRHVTKMGLSHKVRAERVDVMDHEKLVKLIKSGFDCVTSTLISDYNVRVAGACIEAGVNMVDVGTTPQEVFELDKEAKNAGVTIVPSCGLDPGIDRIMEGYGTRKLDTVEEIYLWCGGFPQKGTPGYDNLFRYKVAWYWKRAIESYLGRAKILRDGQVIEVEKLTGPGNPETTTFPEPIGECEAFYTSAPFDTIEHLGLKNVKNAWNKTVRWKGHCDIWTKLIALGLTSAEPLKVKECEVAPFDFMVELGNKVLPYGDGEGDLVVERVHVGGKKDGKKTHFVYELVDLYDKERKVTAMGRTTAYPSSILSQMVARKQLKERGVIHASKIGWGTETAKIFLDEMEKRNLHITETLIQPFT